MIADRENRVDRAYEYAKQIRQTALQLAKEAGRAGSHLGGSFSAVDIIATLYGAVLNIDPKNPNWNARDRFITSKMHCYLASFSALYRAGFITLEQLKSYHEDGGILAGYPLNPLLGLDYSGGSLGMGLSVGIGMALSAKRKKLNNKVYVLLGDGECNEGSVWEGFMSASMFNLDNLVAIIDYNKMQFDGPNDKIMSVAPLSDKLVSFGWTCHEVNGHSIEALFDALTSLSDGKPTAIIANTIKGYGLPSIENKASSHHCVLNDDDYNTMVCDIEEGKYDRIQ